MGPWARGPGYGAVGTGSRGGVVQTGRPSVLPDAAATATTSSTPAVTSVATAASGLPPSCCWGRGPGRAGTGPAGWDSVLNSVTTLDNKGLHRLRETAYTFFSYMHLLHYLV